jgi:hypothetical protein
MFRNGDELNLRQPERKAAVIERDNVGNYHGQPNASIAQHQKVEPRPE